MSDDRHVLDETVLRRALRLERDEVPPRFDTAAIAAAAAAERPRRSAVFVGLAAAGLVGIVSSLVWSTVFGAGPAIADVVLHFALDVVIVLATLLVPIADAVSQPIVPVSLIAACAVALAFELSERKDRMDVHAS